jgi:hypothetical protein
LRTDIRTATRSLGLPAGAMLDSADFNSARVAAEILAGTAMHLTGSHVDPGAETTLRLLR